MIYNEKEVLHGLPLLTSNVFVVEAEQKNYSHTHIVIANDEQDAIIRLKENAKQVIEEVRKNCKPSDFENYKVVKSPSDSDLTDAESLRNDIATWQDELDEFDNDMPHALELYKTLKESIINAKARIKKLESNKVADKETNRFDSMVSRMTYLLDENTKFEVKKLNGNRCYPVAYFDDSRSIVNYVQ